MCFAAIYLPRFTFIGFPAFAVASATLTAIQRSRGPIRKGHSSLTGRRILGGLQTMVQGPKGELVEFTG